MRLETQFIRTFVLNCTKLRTSSNSHPCHPRDGDDCLSAIFFASFLSENLQNVQKCGHICTKNEVKQQGLVQKIQHGFYKKNCVTICPFVLLSILSFCKLFIYS